MDYLTYQSLRGLILDATGQAIQDAIEEAGLSGGGGGGMFKWDEETRAIGAGGCMVGRQWINATGTGSGKADALYSLKVTFQQNGTTAEVVNNATLGQAPTETETFIPIYEITNGKIATDYRGAFVVPAYN